MTKLPVISFFKSPAFWRVFAFLVLALVVYLFFRKDRNSRKNNQTEKEIRSQAKDLGLDEKEIIRDANGIYSALGLDTWYALTEDEAAVIRIVQKYNRSSFKVLSEAYFSRYSRSLESDIYQYLSESDINQIDSIIA